MRFITNILEKLQSHPKRVVFPEGNDPRVIQAARQFFTLKLGTPILLGQRETIKETAGQLGLSMEGLRVINPAESMELDEFTLQFMRLQRGTNLDPKEARNAMLRPNYFATMMLARRRVDVLVSGAADSDGVLLRPVRQILRTAESNNPTLCGCQVIEFPDGENRGIGSDGVLFLADCEVETDPTTERLAEIGLRTAEFASQLLAVPPRVAFLSRNTRSRAVSSGETSREQAAAALAAQWAETRGIKAFFDGELQSDTALVAEIAERKLGRDDMGEVAGRANVLIFPNLDSASITTHFIRHLTRSNVYGDILLGLEHSAAELSRGATQRDIFGVTAILGERCNQYRRTHPEGGFWVP